MARAQGGRFRKRVCEPEIWSARRAPVPTIREPHSAFRALSRGVRLVCPFRISSSVPPCRTFALSSAPCQLGSDKSGARDSTLAAWSSGLDLSYRPTIPIVFTVVSDPVGTGFVKSWGAARWQRNRACKFRAFYCRQMARTPQSGCSESHASCYPL